MESVWSNFNIGYSMCKKLLMCRVELATKRSVVDDRLCHITHVFFVQVLWENFIHGRQNVAGHLWEDWFLLCANLHNFDNSKQLLFDPSQFWLLSGKKVALKHLPLKQAKYR